MAKETNRLNIHVSGCEFEVHVPKEKEQIYLMVVEYVDKKIDAYMDAFVRIPLPQKSMQEVLLMAMYDIAVGSIETRQSLENNSILDKIKNTPQIRNPTKVSERCGPNRQECDFSSSD